MKLCLGVLAALSLMLGVGCVRFERHSLQAQVTAAAFQERSLADLSLAAFLRSNGIIGPWPQPVLDLGALTLVAFYYQPDLGLARAQWATARAAILAAGQRPNPSLSATPAYDPGVPGSPSPWILPFSIEVPIETAGKRSYRIAQAAHTAEAARWKLVGAVWQARSRVRTQLLELYGAEETRLLQGRQEQAQSNVVRLLQGELDAGMASGFELTQARITLDTIRLALEDSQRKLAQARTHLAAAIGLPVVALTGARFDFGVFDSLPGELTAPEVRRQALLSRADVRGALAEYAASQSALQLAIAGQYPDVQLGPGYAWNSGNAGDNEWQLGLKVTLPILNQNHGAIAEASARRREVAAHFSAVQAQAISEIDSALAGYRAASQVADTATALAANLQRRLQDVRAMAQAGQSAPLDVANAEIEFATGELSRLGALLKAQQLLGQLEDAVQSPLTLPNDAIRNAERAANPSDVLTKK